MATQMDPGSRLEHRGPLVAERAERAAIESLGSRALAARFRLVRGATLQLTAPLAAEDQVVQALPETSPTKWHLGHTTWFFEMFLPAAARARVRELRRSLRLLVQLLLLHSRADARALRARLAEPSRLWMKCGNTARTSTMQWTRYCTRGVRTRASRSWPSSGTQS